MLPVLINKRQEIKAIAKRDIFISMAGGVFLFVHFFCWFTAVKYTTIASGVTIAALHPIIVMIMVRGRRGRPQGASFPPFYQYGPVPASNE